MSKNFRTTDMYLAAYLTVKGHRIVSTERREDNRVEFQFGEGSDESVDPYMMGEAQVNATAFVAAIKRVKGYVFRSLGQEEIRYGR